MAGIFGLLMSGAGVIKDQYFNLTSLLLPGNGTDGKQNRTFKDSSVNDFLITPNGNTTQGTFSPFSQTGWGNRFDGTSGQLAFPTGSFVFGSSDFTIEAWVYNTGTTTGTFFNGQYTSGASTTSIIGAIGSSNGNFDMYIGGAPYSLTGINPALNQWVHLAVVRTGGTVSVFQNGTRTHTRSDLGTLAINTGGTTVAPQFGNGVNGTFSNYRIIIGSGPYDATQASITVPTAPLTATANTKLLTAQSNRFVDNNASPKTITVTGTPAITPFSPFAPTQSYSASAVGGSGYFDGSSDYLQFTDSSNVLDLGGIQASLEFWVYLTNTSVQNLMSKGGMNSGSAWSTTDGGEYAFAYNSGVLYFTVNNAGGTLDLTGNFVTNQWNHVVVATNTSNAISMYINGVRTSGPTTNAITKPTTRTTVRIGTFLLANWTNGYMSSIRHVTGSSAYDPTQTSITVPTAPLTAVSGTSLLLNFTNGGVIDATAKNVLETVGNAQISTTQSKWGGGSMRFPQSGTSDYLYKPYDQLLNQLNGNFTIEAWIYPTATSTRMIFAGSVNSAGNENWFFEITSANKLSFAFSSGGSTATATSSASISQNTWTYVAVVRNGGTITQYINGSADGTSSPTGTYKNASYGFAIGRAGDYNGLYFTGYIDDFRMTIGQARTITASPSSPFALQ